MRMFTSWLSWVPTPCPLCQAKSRGAQLCAACLQGVCAAMRDPVPRCACCALRLGQRLRCPDCATRRPAFHAVIAGFDYEAPGDALIRQFKTARQWQLARPLATLLAQAIHASDHVLPSHAVLVPIPARAASIRQRGFNPAAEVARALACYTQHRYAPSWLLRRHEGARQTHAAKLQRLHATRQDFVCPPQVQDQVIAVVDDVMTTGSTLHHAAHSLRQAGAAQVWGLVLARTPLPQG